MDIDNLRQLTSSPAVFWFFSDAVTLPEQFYTRPDHDQTCGVLALVAAVLEDALACFQKQFLTRNRRAQREAQQAEEWFFIDDLSWPFSFVNICAALDLDPESIRLQLVRWHERSPVKRRRAPQRAGKPDTRLARLQQGRNKAFFALPATEHRRQGANPAQKPYQPKKTPLSSKQPPPRDL